MKDYQPILNYTPILVYLSTRRNLGYNLTMRSKRFPRIRVRPSARHKRITFVGDDGKLWRNIAIGVGIALVVVMIVVTSRPEPQLMSSAEIQSVEARGILRVGVRDGMQGLSNDGDGLEVALARALADRMLSDASGESAVKLVTITSATAGARLNDSTIDVAFALLEKDVSPKYLYSDAYYTDTARFVMPEGKANDPLHNITVGCLQPTAWMSSSEKLASAGQTLLDTYITAHPNDGIKTRTFASYDDMFVALQSGEVGAIVLTDLYIQKYGESYAFSVSPTPLGSVEYAMACTTDCPAFVELFNLLLSEMKADGSLAALYAQYGLMMAAE